MDLISTVAYWSIELGKICLAVVFLILCVACGLAVVIVGSYSLVTAIEYWVRLF